MKHFKSAHHEAAASAIAFIATWFGQASTAVGLAKNAIMLDPSNDLVLKKQLNIAIANIGQARQQIDKLFGEFRQDGGPTEAKDVDSIVEDLIDTDLLKLGSPALDMVMNKGLDVAFSKLDTLANIVTGTLESARDNFTPDGTDSYLSYTVPIEDAVSDMSNYVRDLHVVIAATWRDHVNLPGFAIKTDGTAAEQRASAVAA